ncbi:MULTISPECIES: hypothetical protein [unclassified Streptomyces]|uniref:hypothetical protein n=1 Tax=unclassified Streptomyces TaxID=2593676 RepID=UPI002DD9A974|nr:hypothetical protein [Streptomyces sp. NBC_01591]WSD71896.1 hypothetical protein OG978_33595 [Streptomyces sp. NBC_01591]WSX04937.1 hypothetical protein OG355_33360 [Streptomyces sp. NBC_00987]
MTTKGTPGRMVRIEEEVWAEYGQLCDEEGTSRGDDLRRHAYARVNAWRKAQGLPARKRITIKRRKPAADSD